MNESVKIKLTPSFDILENVIKEWWQHLSQFVMVYVWSIVYALAPLAVCGAMIALAFWAQQNGMPILEVTAVVLSGLAAILAFYFALRGQIGIFLLIKGEYKQKERELYRQTSDWFWPYLGLSLLTGIMVLLWMLLLIIPGIIYAVLYGFAGYVLFFEGKRGWAALKRSVDLVTGYWWPVAGRLLVLGIFVWAISAILAMPVNAMIEGSLAWNLYNAFLQIVNMLIGPIALLYSLSIYRELVKIKDRA